MAAEINLHRAKFRISSVVRIKSAGQLEAFRRNGKLRFPPSENQVAPFQADAIRIQASLHPDE